MNERNHDEGELTAAAVMARFPGWDVYPVFGGWQATPAGTPVVQSIDLDGIAEKLAALEGGAR